MHWSEKIAEELIRRSPDKEEYVCAAGISPSGSIHIGNFRDIATSLFVAEALKRKGKKARLLFSWDEFDRLRKVPVNVQQITEGYEQYIGYPYIDAPNPFDTEEKNYAEYFEKEFEHSVKQFGIEMDYRYQAAMYRDGSYTQHIITALDKRAEIFDILDSFRTQDAGEGEKEAYYPASIFCPACKRDTTKIVSYSDAEKTAEYRCECGHTGSFDFKTDTNCKLAWKIDWPMRWMYEGVDFEPGGKDHAAPGGSYDTSRVISEKIYGYPAPLFTGYEFIGIKGTTGKMSGSSGLNLTPATLLKIYQPEILLWLYARVEPGKAFDLCFDDGILRQYFEFDKMYNAYVSGEADEHGRSVMQSCLINGERIKTVPMSLLVQLGSVVNFNVEMLETVFAKIDQPYKYDDFRERLDLARYWLENCSPENAYKLLPHRNWNYYETLSAEDREAVTQLHTFLDTQSYTLDELNAELYAIPKRIHGENAENLKKIQGNFFKNVYRLLLDREKGPRLYLFLFAVEKESYVSLLDFSTEKTDEERAYEASLEEAGREQETPEEPAVVYGEADEVKPVADEIDIDTFNTVDLRVCKVLKCQEIRKSHSCYKLTLDDGLDKRVIVSSIKDYYKPEDLTGKKIIVVANLKPARIAGVKSQGMLLAGTNNACGCKVVIVDDAVPVGTRIC